MKSIIIDVPRSGARVEFVLSGGSSSGQVVVVLADGVEIRSAQSAPQPATRPALAPSPTSQPTFREFESSNGFPPRALTEQCIVQILREHGGSVKIRDRDSGWNIYDEIAARLGVSVAARRRLTSGTGEPAWRPECGFARKNLEQTGVLHPTAVSGHGVWSLSNKPEEPSLL